MKLVTTASNTIHIAIGKQIRSQRERLGLSQADLAELLGIPAETIEHFENGAGNIGPKLLLAVAAALHVPIHYFFAGLPPVEERDASNESLNADDDGFDMMRIFMQIKNPNRRRDVIKFAMAILNQETSEQDRVTANRASMLKH